MTPPNTQPDDTVPATLEELRPWLRDMRRELKRNTETTEQIAHDTAEIVQAFKAAQGFWATVQWVGDAGAKLAKFAAVCALAGAAVWLWVKGFFESKAGGA